MPWFVVRGSWLEEQTDAKVSSERRATIYEPRLAAFLSRFWQSLEKMGFFDKIKQSLTRTTQQFVERFDEAIKGADSPDQRSRPVDVDTIEALEEALISADVGVAATERIIEAVRARRSRSE